MRLNFNILVVHKIIIRFYLQNQESYMNYYLIVSSFRQYLSLRVLFPVRRINDKLWVVKCEVRFVREMLIKLDGIR